jgi:hypothetical protein
MRAVWVIVSMVALAVLAVAASGCDSLVNRLNLLGQTRYTVGDQVYGIEMIQVTTQTRVGVSLVRAVPVGQIDESDAEAIRAVEGIVLVDAAGQRIPPREVVAQPGEHESGFVTLVFDIAGHEGPFVLEWPGHEPFDIGE